MQSSEAAALATASAFAIGAAAHDAARHEAIAAKIWVVNIVSVYIIISVRMYALRG